MSVSIALTSERTILTEIIGTDVGGKNVKIFIAMLSGFPKPQKANTTGIAGRNIKTPLAEVFGSLIVAAIAEKNVFQKKNPASDKINRQKIKTGLVITRGIDHPLPNNPDNAKNKIVLNELTSKTTKEKKEIPSIFPSIHVCALIAATITSVILVCFSPVIAVNSKAKPANIPINISPIKKPAAIFSPNVLFTFGGTV